MTSGIGTERWPLNMCGSVPQTPQCVTLSSAPSLGGGASGYRRIWRAPGAVRTAARITRGCQSPDTGPAGSPATCVAGAPLR